MFPRPYMLTLKVWEFGGKLKSLWIRGNPIGLRLSDNITRLQNLELLGNASSPFREHRSWATYAAAQMSPPRSSRSCLSRSTSSPP